VTLELIGDAGVGKTLIANGFSDTFLDLAHDLIDFSTDIALVHDEDSLVGRAFWKGGATRR
jgi:hypothetical protein